MRRALALVAAVALAGCGRADPAPSAGEAGTPADSTPRDSVGGAAGSPSDAAVPSPAIGPPPLPALPGEGELRMYRLRLVNRASSAATVFASANAARVVLDTVPGRDSVLVDIRLRADRVELEAEDERGRRLASSELDLVAGDINRWVIVERSEPPSGAPSALVRGESAGYPRIRSE